MILGEKIQQLRKEKGMSQEQLAAQLTISRQAISKWELGESIPDTDNILQLSKLFDVSTDYLLNDEIEINKVKIQEPINPNAQVPDNIPAVKNNRVVFIIKYTFIVLAIYMIFFAFAIITKTFLALPFYAMLATAVSIIVVILMTRKKH